MTDTVLEKKYEEPVRPYSKNELTDLRRHNHRKLFLGKVRVEHPECKHFYFAKAHGKKEKQIQQDGMGSAGNCSVCWKLYKTPRRLKKQAQDLINEYSTLYDEPPYWTYGLVDLERDFYTWLYNEFNPKRQT